MDLLENYNELPKIIKEFIASFDEEKDPYKECDRVLKACEKYGYTQSGECKAKEYRDKMKQSKICISPFGQGEICHRTFEAIRLGAVPIIPDSSYIETWPDILSSCIQCKHDFSDLELKINTILCSEQKRNKLRYNIVKEAWDNKVFSKRFYNLKLKEEALREIIENGNYKIYAFPEQIRLKSFRDLENVKEIILMILKQMESFLIPQLGVCLTLIRKMRKHIKLKILLLLLIGELL